MRSATRRDWIKSSLEDSFLNFQQRVTKKWRRLINRLAIKQHNQNERDSFIWGLSPEDKAAYDTQEEQIKRDTMQINEIMQELSQLENEENITKAKLSSLEKELKDYEIRLEITHTNLNRKRKEYDMQKEKDLIKFMSAFLIGKMHYEYINKKS